MRCLPFGNQTPSFSMLQEWELKENIWTVLQWVLSCIAIRVSHLHLWPFPPELHTSPSPNISIRHSYISAFDNFHLNFTRPRLWPRPAELYTSSPPTIFIRISYTVSFDHDYLSLHTPPNQRFDAQQKYLSTSLRRRADIFAEVARSLSSICPSSRHQLLRTMQLITRVILAVT
jgi:hypothetical protein